jgi:plastocyanin
MWEKGCRFYLGGLAAAGAMAALTCGGSSSPAGPSPGPGTGTVRTITITASGVDPKETRIDAGQQVRFVNSNNRPHEIQSNPHERHDDCPAVNQVATLSPGQNRMTGPLNQVRACGFHDHLDADNAAFRGVILVGGADPDPGDPYGGSGGS